jgi:LPXTG-motif cell wall-anchored protein
MNRIRSCVVALVAVSVAAVLIGPGAAEAGLGAGAAPTFPAVVTVGDVGIPATIQVENDNTPPNVSNTVCNSGDDFPCPANDPGITLIPSCAQLGTFSACAPAGADPGVFQVSPTGTGAAGSACAGMAFAITLIDPTFGQLRFTPQPVGTHVVLPATNSRCQINFTFDVVKSPIFDQNPIAPGNQTVQVVDNTQHDGGEITASGRGTSSGVTVLRATPTISTIASPTIKIGGQLVDSILVSGLVNPQPGATVDARLYGPNDATCSGLAVFESVVAYPVGGGPVTSAPFTPTLAGAYRWVASYSGDANNSPVTGACNDVNESATVTQATPAISTTASGNVVLGGQFVDVATVTGLVNPQPGATVTMRLYGPDDATCAGAPVFQSTVAYPVGGGPVTSAPVVPSVAGTYRWIATYSGDVNNAAVSGACNDVGESSTVATPVPPPPPDVVSKPPVPAIPVVGVPTLPATGTSSHALVLLAAGLLATGCLLVGSTRPRRRSL